MTRWTKRSSLRLPQRYENGRYDIDEGFRASAEDRVGARLGMGRQRKERWFWTSEI